MPETATQRLPRHVDVLIVGGGPTGLTAACLLGRYGLRVLVVERNLTTSDEAKAISLDDESLRTLQAAGVDESIYPVIVPGTGTLYLSAKGKPLFHARGPKVRRHGHPFKNPFAQPDLEAALVSGLGVHSTVDLEFGTELRTFTDEGDRIEALLVHADGSEETVAASYLLGCDGGRSSVRDLLGVPMKGASFDDLWLVADTLQDPHDERYGIHVGDPRRPHVIVPGLKGRCRYEFKLQPGEAVAGPDPSFELVRRLVGTYRDLASDQLERSVVYSFHALMADRLHDGRCFLLGDAAHMMPPFAGQGLNSGVRDAMNLSWKVAAVIKGMAGPGLLETYEAERRPHAEATIALSVRLGAIVMTSSRLRARLRDLVVGSAMHVPPLRRYLTEMRYRPEPQFHSGAIVPGGRRSRTVGVALPQVAVLSGSTNAVARLDDVLGGFGAVVGIDVSGAQWATIIPYMPSWAHRHVDLVLDDRAPRPEGGRDAVADLDGTLQECLASHRGQFLLVRPDRIVAAAFSASEAPSISLAMSRFEPDRSTSAILPTATSQRVS